MAFLFYNMYYTYIIQSLTTGSHYIGSTNNLTDRLLRHNSGQNKYTRTRGPWKLLHSVEFETRAEAVQLEKKLKSWKSKKRVLAWIVRESQ